MAARLKALRLAGRLIPMSSTYPSRSTVTSSDTTSLPGSRLPMASLTIRTGQRVQHSAPSDALPRAGGDAQIALIWHHSRARPVRGERGHDRPRRPHPPGVRFRILGELGWIAGSACAATADWEVR